MGKAPSRGGDASISMCGVVSRVAAIADTHCSSLKSGKPSGVECHAWNTVASLCSANSTTRGSIDSDASDPPPMRRTAPPSDRDIGGVCHRMGNCFRVPMVSEPHHCGRAMHLHLVRDTFAKRPDVAACGGEALDAHRPAATPTREARPSSSSLICLFGIFEEVIEPRPFPAT